MKYKAFISYKHEVSSWQAQKIESALKSYAKPLLKRPIKIFRDEVHLPAGVDLSASIKEALNDSEYLLLLASKEAAESFYNSEQYQPFKKIRQSGSNGNFLLVVGKDDTGQSTK